MRAASLTRLGSGKNGTVNLSLSMADYTYLIFSYSSNLTAHYYDQVIVAVRTYSSFKTTNISGQGVYLVGDENGRYMWYDLTITYKSDTSITLSAPTHSATLYVFGI